MIENTNTNSKIIFDINTKSIDDLISILLSKNFEYLVIQPWTDYTKISFSINWNFSDVKYVKNETYQKILNEIKLTSKLDLAITSEQKWIWERIIDKKKLDVIVKTQASSAGEIVYLKTRLSQNQNIQNTNNAKKMSTQHIMSFAFAILVIVLILWASFISFVVFNAKTPQDVAFFKNLWISLNDINSFLSTLATLFFSIFLLIQIIWLVIFLFKALLTKKEFRRKKILSTTMSIFLLITTFVTWTTWMVVDQKIKWLPNWQEMSLWAVQLYDNDVLVANQNKEEALIKDSTRLIWPVNIKIDVKNIKDSEKRNWFNITRYEWIIWGESVETMVPEIVYNFKSKKSYNIKLTLHWTNKTWAQVSKPVEDMPIVNISYLVNIREIDRWNGLKSYVFNAKDLSSLWDIEWYVASKKSQTPDFTWVNFSPSKPFSKQDFVWLRIKNIDTKVFKLDKIFVVGASAWSIDAKIISKQSVNNDLQYDFSIWEIISDLWSWNIEEVEWNILWTNYKKVITDVENPESDSTITHTFTKTDEWSQTIIATLINTTWEKFKFTKQINVAKSLLLSNRLEILVDDVKYEDFEYDTSRKEYTIKNLWAPTKIIFDAKNIKPNSPLYKLTDVKWETNIWEKVQVNWLTFSKEFKTAVDLDITPIYVFTHRSNKEDTVEVRENIKISLKDKESTLDLKITPESEYAPTNIKLDASWSKVKDQNIVMYEFDFWDGWTQETADAIVSSRRYLNAWTYIVKLKVTTDKWNTYNIEEPLVLKQKWNIVKIWTSLKTAPVWQTISFNSLDSEWYIVSSNWDFGDGETSTERNPIHAFSTAWTFKVKLTLMFSWNTQLTDEILVTITE